MDLVIGLLWLMAFSVIVVFLGALNYFLGRTDSDIQSQCDTTNQQSTRTSNNRRKHARNANKRQRKLASLVSTENSNRIDEQKDERENESEVIEEEEEEEFEDPMIIEDEPKATSPVKQRSKDKSNLANSKSTSTSSSPNEESTLPLKPKVNVVPVKQSLSTIPKTTSESTQISQNNHSKSNGHVSSPEIYSYSGHHPIPPRFQQQRQRKSNEKKNKSRMSSASQNHLLSSNSDQQQLELPLQSVNQNGYSSESDNLTESSSIAATLSTESQLSFKRSDLLRSLSPSNLVLDELVSIFDTNSFSSDEIDLILNKIMTQHLLNKQTQQRLAMTNKNEKTIEQLLDETYRSQAKILAIELQSEKTRVSELTKINTEMDQTIRQLQQQPNNQLINYQQTILHYQMQIRRMTDENARLAHQLHAYSIMPASIHELKQQQMILNEQLRHISARNSYLEKEIADGQQAIKHAAEIYKRTDIQKQERIDKMINDLNKYKKIEDELNTLHEKQADVAKHSTSKLDDLTHQRDDLQKSYDELTEHYQQLQSKDDQPVSNSTTDN